MKRYEPQSLPNLEEGTEVELNYPNGDQFAGVFRGMDSENTIMLKALEGNSTMGFPVRHLQSYSLLSELVDDGEVEVIMTKKRLINLIQYIAHEILKKPISEDRAEEILDEFENVAID